MNGAASDTVLFDLDGVLLDSRRTMLATLAGVATAALGRRITPADLPPSALTTPRIEVLTAMGVPDADGACERWWDAALATAGASTRGQRLFPGALEGLMALKDAGTATGLVTLQTRARLPWLLPEAALALLDVTVCRDDAEPKPAPDGILLALDQLGTGTDGAVFLGDTTGDIHAARAAGVTPLGVAWGYATAADLTAAGAFAVLDDPALIGPGLTARTGRRMTTLCALPHPR
ncbi:MULTISPECIES: HAD family hydrolase [Streptomyces]|uniref:HAD family hydrolase n=1 Tax=Streptomyces TaxID=1883 RepID=UPI00068EF764|nr:MULTISPECIES: HAD family hydrolase [Streptomyces]MDI6412273.1 HAD family hydrolase [Streptomyces albus]